MAEKKLYRDDVSGVYTDENGNPVNADQSFGSRPDTAQNAAINSGLLSYLMGKGREAINNPEAPWNAKSGLLAVADTAAIPAKAIGQGLLALPDRIQNVTGAAQRGDYGPATDDAMSVAFSGLPIGAATAPAGVAGMMAGKVAPNMAKHGKGVELPTIKSGDGKDLVNLYHGTTPEAAAAIDASGFIDGGRYYGVDGTAVALTPDIKMAKNYGDSIVTVRVPREHLVVDPESVDHSDVSKAIYDGSSLYAVADKIFVR